MNSDVITSDQLAKWVAGELNYKVGWLEEWETGDAFLSGRVHTLMTFWKQFGEQIKGKLSGEQLAILDKLQVVFDREQARLIHMENE
ncbi:MAG TPA: hypothetical protein VH186_21290 [Chloroflexia bacterium]|nr:hypothetical protein [Chloroflexia bacterium]